ncbi:SDR family oxidoreductase [Actinospica robiniae]|uniref:SDR family oxidoreductase n=1 Tax=Actinospica robiniae TaxID=304901 RepID=UPI0003F86ACA|nr:SDR family oxidoreductase [Actinospica robiniae]
MDIKGKSALVTGANRGIGKAFTRGLLDHGAAKVYAAVRDPESVQDPDVVPVRLNVTDPVEAAEAAELAHDVAILVNNAGVGGYGTHLLEGDFDAAREAMDVNYFGTWLVARNFAPVLARNGGGALVNMLSVASWVGRPRFPGYAGSKAAQWSLTNSFREGLRDQGTLVVGVHAGFVDTDLSKQFEGPKITPQVVVEETMQAIVEGRTEVLADEPARRIKASLA